MEMKLIELVTNISKYFHFAKHQNISSGCPEVNNNESALDWLPAVVHDCLTITQFRELTCTLCVGCWVK